VIGTLGKALGSYGAYACASAELVRLLINTARPLIFSTAPSPPAAAGALAALELLERDPQRVQRLRHSTRVLRSALAGEGFPVSDGEIQIVPLVVGDERAAMELCRAALERGVLLRSKSPICPRRDCAPACGDGLTCRRAATRGPCAGEGARELGRAGGDGPLHEERPFADDEEVARARATRSDPEEMRPAAAGAGPRERPYDPRARARPERPRRIERGGASRARLFVTATDTEGKTVCERLLPPCAAGEPVRAYKPVITGLEEPQDTGRGH
jgi:hypothetical protein